MANKKTKKKAQRKTAKRKSRSRSVAPPQKARLNTTPANTSKAVLHTLATAVASVAEAQSTLTDGQCDNIASDCVRRITGSKREYSRADQLQQYGVNTDQQSRAIVDLIIGDKTIGVHRYNFKIVDTSKISGLAPSWTMGQLANTVQSSAIPA